MINRGATAKTRGLALLALNLLRESEGRLSLGQLAVLTHTSPYGMQAAIRLLTKRGKVDHEGKGPGSGYIVRTDEDTCLE